MLRLMLEQSGYMDMRRADKTPESDGRIENIQELIGEFKSKYENFEQYLEYVSLVTDNEVATAEGDFVSVMTLHAAKGLEFDVVFLPGWEEGQFPNKKSLDENNGKGLEEERRLAYVGITRAKKEVYISYVNSRYVYGHIEYREKSGFIEEIPPEHVEFTNPEYYNYGNSRGGGYGGDRYGGDDFDRYGDGWGRFSKTDRFGFDRYDAPDDDEYDGRERKSYGGGYNKDYTNRAYFIKKEKKTAAAKPVFPAGTTVWHEKYGRGTVVSASGKSTEVLFDDGATKKIMADYLEKA